MKFLVKCALLLMPALALAMPASAARDPRLSDSQQPGSVIIFPKFITGVVHVDGVTLPRTEIEIGAVCPPGVSPGLALCQEHQAVKIRFHWVCPGTQDFASKWICRETDFDVSITVNGKLAFTANGDKINTNSPRVPKPPCKNGYLIGYVIDNADRAIKFDGLIGDAVLRGPDNAVAGTSVVAGQSTAVSAYSAITIQATPNTGAAGETPNPLGLIATAGNRLAFDGSPNHYLGVTGVVYGDVKFDNEAPAHSGDPSPANAFSRTYLTLLTLDVNSNAPNNPVFARLNFYNESSALPSTTNPNFENLTSTFTEFLCWEQVQLTTLDGNLTQAFQQTRKGVFIGGPAEKISGPFGGDSTGPVTLLGIVHTVEGTQANAYQERSYIFNLYNDSVFVPTDFNFLPLTTPTPAPTPG